MPLRIEGSNPSKVTNLPLKGVAVRVRPGAHKLIIMKLGFSEREYDFYKSIIVDDVSYNIYTIHELNGKVSCVIPFKNLANIADLFFSAKTIEDVDRKSIAMVTIARKQANEVINDLN